jgi:hypothetical protein
MIPNVPSNVVSQIEREKFITQKALWQIETRTQSRQTKTKKLVAESMVTEQRDSRERVSGENDALLNSYE